MIIKDNRNIQTIKYNDTVELECYHCKKSFYIIKKYVTHELKHTKGAYKYCSPKCSQLASCGRKLTQCANCSKEIMRTRGELNKSTSKLFFCSHSCSATYSNSHSPLRIKPKLCGKCKKVEVAKEQRMCTGCKQSNCLYSDATLLCEIDARQQRDANRYSIIRERARRKLEAHSLLNECELCKYAKHVVACHIKNIASFDKAIATLGEVNALENLIGLCSNCHWELDHDALSDEDKIKLKQRHIPSK